MEEICICRKVLSVNGATPDENGNVTVDTSGLADDSSVVHKTGDETITGSKTFNSTIIGSVTGNAATANKATSADSVEWNNVKNKPTTYKPSSHTHDDRYYTENEVNNLLNGKANTSGTYGDLTVGKANIANSVDSNSGANRIYFNWSDQVSGFVGLKVDSTKMGGIVTTDNLPTLLGGIGVYDIGSTIHACTGVQVEYGATVAGSALKYAAMDAGGGIYDLNRQLTTVGTWLKVSGNSGNTGGFGLYRRIA